jgi:hypothetical protein
MRLKGDQWTYELADPSAKPAGQASTALKLLQKAIDEAGEVPPACNHVPPNVRAVPETLWRKYCYQGSISEGDNQDARRKAFNRAAGKLQQLGKMLT